MNSPRTVLVFAFLACSVSGCGTKAAGDGSVADVTGSDTDVQIGADVTGSDTDVQIGADVTGSDTDVQIGADVTGSDTDSFDGLAGDTAAVDANDSTGQDGVDVPASCTEDKDCALPTPCVIGKCVIGSCSYAPSTVACDDGNACTTGDACAGGKCAPGSTLSCDDKDPCTVDSCGLASGCTHTASTGDCSDGDACTTGDTCVVGLCVGATVDCDDGNTCTADSCDTTSGCQHVALAGDCSDGNACTSGDTCTLGQCVPGAAVSCDDGNVCTTDACDLQNGCTYTDADALPCDDGQKCSTNDACLHGKCQGIVPNCADDNFCTDDTCTDQMGCVHLPSAATCDDGNPCTVSDVCANGTCNPGLALDCDDGLTCTDDFCDAPTGCGHKNRTGACNDGDACTSGDSCEVGLCTGATADCADSNPCTVDSCDKNAGCSHVAVSVATTCDDNNACTLNDLCAGTACKGTAQVCNDGDPCSADGCDPASGCFAKPGNDGAPCDDGIPCTAQDTCANGNCTGTAITCDDGNACTNDSCAGGVCLNVANTATCDDGIACTSDSCNAATGGCVHSAVDSACDDNTTCTTDTCNATTGCLHVSDGTTCNDGNACTNDVCTGGASATGCTHSNVGPGTTCDDGDACTTGDSCNSGTCAGAGPICGDGACTCGETAVSCAADCVSAPAGMALISAGTFWMGCNATKDTNCNSSETPQHKVTLSAYFMDLTETTVAQYKACVDAGVCTVPSAQSPLNHATYPGFPNNPVNYLTWAQSQQYCQWRGTGFDLPTEAQWEMAARGSCEMNGSTAGDPTCAAAMRTYPWGEAVPTCSYAVMSNGTYGCGTNATWAVGSIPAGDSPYGLHDMAGNVWEWNRDWFTLSYYGSSPATNPYYGVSGTERILRGGGANYFAVSLRAGIRNLDAPAAAYDGIGLRCSRPLDLCATVSCPDLPCATQACNPATGQCVATAKPNATICGNDSCTCGETAVSCAADCASTPAGMVQIPAGRFGWAATRSWMPLVSQTSSLSTRWRCPRTTWTRRRRLCARTNRGRGRLCRTGVCAHGLVSKRAYLGHDARDLVGRSEARLGQSIWIARHGRQRSPVPPRHKAAAFSALRTHDAGTGVETRGRRG